MFGWPPLERMFMEKGVYQNLCKDSEEELPCTEQQLRFVLTYTLGSFMNTVSPVIVGFFYDFYGPKITNLFCTSIFSFAFVLFSVSLLYDVELILFGFLLMTFAGPAILLSVFHISNLFPGYELTIMSSYSGFFVLSSVIFPIMELFYDAGVDLGYLLGVYALIYFPFSLAGFFLFPFRAFAPFYEREGYLPIDLEDFVEGPPTKLQAERSEVKGATIKFQLKQKDLWLITIFLSIQSLRVSMYIGTFNERFFGPESTYTLTFAYLLPAGVLFVPLVGWMLDKRGHDYAYSMSLIIAALFGILDLIPRDDIQYITFLFVSYTNTSNWANMFSYLSYRFGFANYGKLLGVVSLCVGAFGLLQYLLVHIAVNVAGNYFAVNLFCLF